MSSTDRVEVCDEDDLPPGEHRIVTTPAGSVGVINHDGEYYAIENRCCHLDGPVATGTIKREIVAEYPGTGKRVEERLTQTPTIACPWHGWEYRLESGEHLADEDVALETYDVSVDNGVVYLEL